MKAPLIAAITLALASTAAVAQRYDDRYDSRYDDRYDRREDARYYETRAVTRYEDRRCNRCGVVVDINQYGSRRGRHDSNTGGTVLGALIGGAIGNQVGSGNGRKAATVAGAVVGGVAGNRIDRNNGSSSGSDRYEVLVQMDDGRRVVLDQRRLNGVREGSRVYVRDGRANLL